jgi:hypothetical protein
MALIDLWQSARESIKDKHIQQVMLFAGNGKLADGNETSSEFRAYLSFVPSDLLARYATECLTTSFDQSGFALQDIVNQIGQRLSFDVTDGAYRGRKGVVGFDGIWKSSIGDDIVVEVKTTDAYRIDMDTLAAYRSSLIKEGRISGQESSILIIVGRQDTGDLEAQIRGSRHAWDMRLISVEALIRLMKLKETVEDLNVMRKICTILTPQEFTKVDGIIDLVFSTAEDVSLSATELSSATNGKGPVVDQLDLGMSVSDDVSTETSIAERPTLDRRQQVIFHEQCVNRVAAKLQTDLVKVSRSIYRTPDGSTAISCAISREYAKQNRVLYWFAFHPYQQEQLQFARKAFTAFGCGTEKVLFLFPLDDLANWLPGLNQTVKEQRSYWHTYISHRIRGNGRCSVEPASQASISQNT